MSFRKTLWLWIIGSIIIALAVAGAFYVVLIDQEPIPEPIVLDDLIRITSPQPGETINSPLSISGVARGSWFFEASFPIRLYDQNGQELGVALAQAQDDWMTSEFVPFVATLSFSPSTTDTGELVFQKDNPSGLPEFDDQRRVPIVFDRQQPEIKLYYYHPELDYDDQKNLLCSEQGLVAVSRSIPASPTPIQDAIRLLLLGELTDAEINQGITTEFPLQGFELQGANLVDGQLTLEFSDPLNQTSGGSCRVNILWKQIEATALQFSDVSAVNYIPEELFQP
ncbi:MAG: Gmad2 immunoglobulin-like domain-containing protein [Candidatus Uhrbacteria bacterium]